MHRYRIATIVLTTLTGLARAASADPIQYEATMFDGLPGIYWALPVGLPGLVQGESFPLGPGTIALNYPNPFLPWNGLGPVDPIDNDFVFELGVKAAPGSPGPFDGTPFIRVQGHINGDLAGPSGNPPRYSGQYAGTATSVEIPGNWAGSTVPEAFLDLVNHPERIRVSAFVTGGFRAYWQTTLTIAPQDPTPVPEPTALPPLAFAAGVYVRRYRRIRGRFVT